MIRAVAYESQLKADRADVHRRLADAIQAPDRLDEDAALIAEHLEAGGELRAAYSWHIRAGTWSHNRADTAAAQTNWQRPERVARAVFETDDDVRSAEKLSRALRLTWSSISHSAESVTSSRMVPGSKYRNCSASTPSPGGRCCEVVSAAFHRSHQRSLSNGWIVGRSQDGCHYPFGDVRVGEVFQIAAVRTWTTVVVQRQ